MTIYYLSSVDGDNASDGLSWDNAFLTFKYAVETVSAAASGPHTLYVDSAHSESLSGGITVTVAGDINILCVNRSGGDALTTGALVGAQTGSARYIVITGAYRLYMYGMTFKNGTGTGSANLSCGASPDGGSYTFESCTFWLATTGTASAIYLSDENLSSLVINAYNRYVNCTLQFGATAQYIIVRGGATELQGCTLDSGGSAPTGLFAFNTHGSTFRAEGCDFSHLGSGNLVRDNGSGGTREAFFVNCKLGSGTVIKAAQTSVVNKGAVTVWAFNCASGDTHYDLYHGDPYGETTASRTVYRNAGALYDGTNQIAWYIDTTTAMNFYHPYLSPYIDVYHSGTSEITPYIEICRSGSATAFDDNEVWSEWTYQGTSGSTKSTLVLTDRSSVEEHIAGTEDAQDASALGASDWTGENATSWFGKLGPASGFTPAEVGHIRARIAVAIETTLYVDPKINGLS